MSSQNYNVTRNPFKIFIRAAFNLLAQLLELWLGREKEKWLKIKFIKSTKYRFYTILHKIIALRDVTPNSHYKTL